MSEGNATERWTKDKSGIFAQEALDKMRSPEKLDMTMPITTPITWMGLIAVALTMLAVIIWSVFGSFTVRADGMGLIMDPRGVSTVTAVMGGRLDRLYIHSGQQIQRGERVAHVEQIQEGASTRMAQYGPELATSELDAMNRVHEFDARRYQMDESEFIYSSFDGIVDELLTTEGSTIASGSPICTLRLTGGRKDLIGVMYVPVDKGKRIKPGQTIQLAPNGTDTSMSGFLIGVVRSVSQYPVSTQAIQKRLSNDHLSQYILQSQQSAVMEVTFDLVKDDTSESGYLWTSTIGDHKPITAGSFVTGSIIIERQPPIQKVFYKLSQWLRNR